MARVPGRVLKRKAGLTPQTAQVLAVPKCAEMLLFASEGDPVEQLEFEGC